MLCLPIENILTTGSWYLARKQNFRPGHGSRQTCLDRKSRGKRYTANFPLGSKQGQRTRRYEMIQAMEVEFFD